MENGKVFILIISIAILAASSLNVYYTQNMPAVSASFVLTMLMFIVGTITIGGWIILFIYVPYHAKKNGHSMPLWGFLAFFFGPVAALIYVLAVEPKQVKKTEKKS